MLDKTYVIGRQVVAALPGDEHHDLQNFHNLPTSRFLHHLVHKTSLQCHLKPVHPPQQSATNKCCQFQSQLPIFPVIHS